MTNDNLKEQITPNSLPYRFCPIDGAVLVAQVYLGMKGWKCPEEDCPYFEPDDNAPV